MSCGIVCLFQPICSAAGLVFKNGCADCVKEYGRRDGGKGGGREGERREKEETVPL